VIYLDFQKKHLIKYHIKD